MSLITDESSGRKHTAKIKATIPAYVKINFMAIG